MIPSSFNAHASGAVAEVAGTGPDVHRSTLVPALLSAMGDDDHADVQNLAKKAAEILVFVIDKEGIGFLTSELLKGIADNQASTRRSCAYLIGYFFNKSKLDLVDEAPNMISALIILLSDSDSATVVAACEALSKVVASVPKEVLPSYINLVRDAVSTSCDKQRSRKNKQGRPIVIKALQPLLPIYLEGLLRKGSSAELREQAAQGLGELIEVTSEKALEEFLLPITGSLIRILRDVFPWQVKNAILSTLTLMLTKSGMALEDFFPFLQTTFIQCLHEKSRTVRASAAVALGKLGALTPRVDTLISRLLTALQEYSEEVSDRWAIIFALRVVIKHVGESGGGDPLKARVEYSEEVSDRWAIIFALRVVIKHVGESVGGDPLKARVYDHFKPILNHDDNQGICQKFRFVRKIVLSIASELKDDSSEVRRKGLFALKVVAKVYPDVITLQVCIYGPLLAECLKDGNTRVRLAAERCALHALQLTRGGDELAQKYITGSDARRISELFSESSYYSDDNEVDSASG